MRNRIFFIGFFLFVIGFTGFAQQKGNADSIKHQRIIDSILKKNNPGKFKADTSKRKLDTTKRKLMPDSLWRKRLDSLKKAKKADSLKALNDTTHHAVVTDTTHKVLKDTTRHDTLTVKWPLSDTTKRNDSLKAITLNDSSQRSGKDTVTTAATTTTSVRDNPPKKPLPLITAIALSILLIGFFSGIEIAFVSASKLSVELKKKQGSYAGKIWSTYMDRPTRFIGTMLIVLNLLLVVYGLLWSNVLEGFWNLLNIHNPYIKLTVETLASTLVLLFFEFIFKAYFRAKNDTIISSGIVAFIIQFFYSVFASVASVFVNMAEWILKYMFNVKLHDRKEVFSKIDLEHFIQQNKTHDIQENTEMNNELFENVLSLSEIKVRTCLIPRKEIEGVEMGASLEEVRKKFVETKLSKLIVYEGNIDNVLGYIHQLDMFKKPLSLRAILLPIPAIPESMSATDLISKFSKERKSIAWVVDEFGGTAGIITMEDILEEIFGDIKDEYDTAEEFVDKQLSANEYIFSGRLELDYITEKYKLPFRHDEETETLSGYIISQHETIPKQKDRIIIDDYEFDILNVSETRIETVKLKVLK
jgi:putative hemolysin